MVQRVQPVSDHSVLALMANRFTQEQSTRLFALTAVGETLGAIAGLGMGRAGPWLAASAR